MAHFSGGSGPDVIAGTNDDDEVRGFDGADTLRGLWGNDLIYGNLGADIIYGNQGADRLFGGQGADIFYGGQDADLIYGNRGDDVVYGNLGNDVIYGDQGNDVLYGGQGNDILVGGIGQNRYVGGLGFDAARVIGTVNDYVLGRDGSTFVLTSRDGQTDDRIDESVERVIFSNGQYLAVGDLSRYIASATLPDDAGGAPSPAAPLPTLSISDAAAVPEGGDLVYTLTLSAVPTQNVSVTITAGGTASASDITGIAFPYSLTFPAGDTNLTRELRITTTTDNDQETAETLQLTVTATGASIADGSGTGSIIDVPPPPPPPPPPPLLLLVGDAAASEGGQVAFRVQTVNGVVAPADITFGWTTSDYFGGGATPGLDFSPTAGPGVIRAGSNVTDIYIQAATDSLVEGTEQFLFTIFGASGADIVGDTATGTIFDTTPP